MKRLSGKVVLVTGASRGICKAIAIQCATEGADVAINYSSNAALAEEVAVMCRDLGVRAFPVGFNIGDSNSVNQGVEAVVKELGKIDILVNNAGLSRDGLLMRMKDDDWLTTINVNLSGAFYCSRAVCKQMMKARWGRIINISSIIGEMGNAGQVPYSSSKAGLIGMTKSVAKELASRNITVNTIAPGFIETDMTEALDPTTKEQYLTSIPLGRFGAASEIAKAVIFLGSEDAAYITGQVLSINGGLYM